MTDIRFENKYVGDNQPVYIIAEAGVNHNGDMEMARRLVVEAKKAGADCVKFQTFKAERIVTKNAPKADYQLFSTDPSEKQLDMLRQLELRESDFAELLMLCRQEGITFLSTPYSIEDVDFLDRIGVGVFKIASALLVEPYFLAHVARKGKPIILSTGMATLAEVDEAVRVIRGTGNDQIVLLQCTTDYPAKVEYANLCAMQTMKSCFGLLVGYSDHTETDTACILSIGLGAKVIEKHFTLDKNLKGPDHSASFDPAEFRRMVIAVRDAEKALGCPWKQPGACEMTNLVFMRRSIVAKCFISAGEVVTEDMLTFKRPATGIPPREMDRAIGCKAKHDIEEDQIVTWSMLERD